jgi:hypothetical protein
MIEDPPPLLPEIRDAWGRVYVPRDPSPQLRSVPLHAGDLLGLWIWCKLAAIARQDAGELEAAVEERWKSIEYGRIAVELQPLLREYIDADGKVRGLGCAGSA